MTHPTNPPRGWKNVPKNFLSDRNKRKSRAGWHGRGKCGKCYFSGVHGSKSIFEQQSWKRQRDGIIVRRRSFNKFLLTMETSPLPSRACFAALLPSFHHRHRFRFAYFYMLSRCSASLRQRKQTFLSLWLLESNWIIWFSFIYRPWSAGMRVQCLLAPDGLEHEKEIKLNNSAREHIMALYLIVKTVK